jgi:hypothetical protein
MYIYVLCMTNGCLQFDLHAQVVVAEGTVEDGLQLAHHLLLVWSLPLLLLSAAHLSLSCASDVL